MGQRAGRPRGGQPDGQRHHWGRQRLGHHLYAVRRGPIARSEYQPHLDRGPQPQPRPLAVNGSATTAMRSDGTPALSQSIAPTWTGLHTHSPTLNSSSAVTSPLSITPTASTTSTGGWTGLLVNVTQSSDTGSGVKRLGDF